MLLSLSGFLFEDDYNSQSLSLAEFCELAGAAGYGGVELRRTQITPEADADQRRTTRRVVEGHGLMVTCLTARGIPKEDGPQRDAFLASYLDLCADLGCGLLKIGGDPAWLRTAAEQAAARGVVLASNNHMGGPMQTVGGALDQLRAVGHANYGLLYDPMHLMVAGEDYIGEAPRLAPHTRNILVQCVRPAGSADEAVIEGGGVAWTKCRPGDDGSQDWRAVFAAFKRAGYDGPITVIENHWPPEARRAVAQQWAAYLHECWSSA